MMYVVFIIMLLAIWGNPNEATAICNPTAASVTQNENQMMGAESCDLSGNLRTTLGTLLSCEDQTNNLCMTSGGAVRSKTMASAVSTNTTSAVTQPPTGPKSIQGILTCNAGGSTNCGITFTVYGSALNTQATGTKVELCAATIPTGAAVTSSACPVITAPYLYMWIETTGVAGTSPSLTVTAMY